MKNKKTGDVFELNIKYSELQDYLTDNPDVEQIFNKFPATGDSVRLGKRRPDNSFKDVLKKAKDSHKYSTVNDF